MSFLFYKEVELSDPSRENAGSPFLTHAYPIQYRIIEIEMLP